MIAQQVLDNVEDKCLSFLCNRITGQVSLDIGHLILHFFLVYGKITPQKLISKYDSVQAFQYSIEELTDVTFPAVEDLIKISELKGRSYFLQHIVDIGYLIISMYRIFTSDI